MKTMVYGTYKRVTIWVMIFFLASSVQAQPGGGRGNGPGPGFRGEGPRRDSMQMMRKHRMAPGIPGLSKDQEKKIEQSRNKMAKELIPLRNQLAEKKAHLRTQSQAEKPDQASIDKTIDEMMVLRGQMMKLRSHHQQEVRAMLSDEQRLFFDARKGGKKGGKTPKGKKGPGRCQRPAPFGEDGPPE